MREGSERKEQPQQKGRIDLRRGGERREDSIKSPLGMLGREKYITCGDLALLLREYVV